MKKSYLFFPAMLMCLVGTNAMAQTGHFGQLFKHHKAVLEMKERFATGGKITQKPPFPTAPAAARKPTAMNARLKAIYYMEYDGVGFKPQGDSTSFYWSGTRGGGVDFLYLEGLQYELYREQFPVSYDLFQIEAYRTFYAFDSMNTFQWNEVNGYYSDLNERAINSLNSQGYSTSVGYTHYDSATSSWVSDSKTLMAYEHDTVLISIHEEDWDGTAWEKQGRTEYSYTNGKLTATIDLEWDNGSGTWEKEFRTVYGYDSGNITSVVDQYWDTDSSSWINEYRTVNTYNNGNRIIEEEQEWIGGAWEPVSRITYTFNADGKVTSQLPESWDGTTWRVGLRSTATYDNSGNIVSWVAEMWNGSVWTNVNAFDYEYSTTSAGVTHRITMKSWDNGSTSWTNGDRYVVEYNSYGLTTGFYIERWQAADSTWKLLPGNSKTVLLYEEFEDSTSTNVAATAGDVKLTVYPNPANDQLFVEGSLNGNIRVADMTGREVWKGNAVNAERAIIPTSRLAPGIYILQVRTIEGTVATRPISIQR